MCQEATRHTLCAVYESLKELFGKEHPRHALRFCVDTGAPDSSIAQSCGLQMLQDRHRSELYPH
jgi:hypothetical protein